MSTYIKHEPSFEDQQRGRALDCPVCWKRDVRIDGGLQFDSKDSRIVRQLVGCRLCGAKWVLLWYINEVENVTKPIENSTHFILSGKEKT